MKYLLTCMALSAVIGSGEVPSPDYLNEFANSMSAAIESENMDEVIRHYNKEYIKSHSTSLMFENIFAEYDDLKVSVKIMDVEEHGGLLRVEFEFSITGIPAAGGERADILKKKESLYMERRGNSMVITSDAQKGKWDELKRKFELQYKGKFTRRFNMIGKEVDGGDANKFLSAFHREYLHDGENFDALAQAFTIISEAGGMSVRFSDLTLNERTAALGGWPDNLWVDMTAKVEGPDVHTRIAPPGFFSSGRTTMRLKKADDLWLICGNGELGMNDVRKLSPAGSISTAPMILYLIIMAVFLAIIFPSRRKPVIVAALIILVVMTILFYAGRDDRMNFILISVDTLREDHIGSYGGKGVKTPHIDRLAGEGILFENVSSPIPTTSPSHASLLTSLYPRRHGVLRNGWKLSPDFVTLAEVFKGNGYKTAAFVSAFQVGSDFGFGQGFDYFDDDIKHGTRTAGEMLQVIFPWLEKNSEKPFFMWVHLFDPHVPLMPPEPFKSGYSGGDSQKELYRGEVAYTDSRLGMLWEALETLGITDNTCIIFTADHGHSMGEHGYWGHAGQLFEVTTRVPLIIKVPPGFAAEKSIVAQPSRIGTRIRIVDIYKTILDLAGIEIPNGLQGSSFLALMKQNGPRNGNDRDVFMETEFWKPGGISSFHKDAALIGPWKLIRYRNSPNELYNIVEDPAENNNVAEDQPQIHDRLVETIEKWKKQNKPNQAALRYQEVDEKTRKKLEAFGYFY